MKESKTVRNDVRCMVKFHLDRKESKEAPIFLSLHHRGRRYKVFTGKKIDPLKWDVNSCRANPRKYKNNCIGFNAFLQGISDEVENLLNENRPISKADLKAIVDAANGKNTSETFFGFAEAFINQQLAKGELEAGSAKNYLVTLSHLRERNPSLAFEDVDLNFYDKFVTFLTERKGLSVNSIGGHIKRLKWFMAAALDRDLHNNVSFKKKAFKAHTEETDQVYLTRAEIKKLANKALPPRLKRVADAFVLNCDLGMRYSDLAQIQKGNFVKEGDRLSLDMVQGKTGEKIRIPIPPSAIPLLRKYKFTCPVVKNGKLMSVQNYNDYLKDAAEKAGLDQSVDIRTDGEVKKFPKYTQIKSHTARRSFATNLYLDGVAVQNIMAITGHKKEQTFLLYVRADQLTKSRGLADHYEKSTAPAMTVTRGGKAASR